MTRHLQGQSPHFAFANSWLAQRLSEQGLTIEQLVRADGQAQAADQISMGNSIISLRFLSSNDWRDFVEKHSLVEANPARGSAFMPSMDFTTRDRYRHVIEEIAKRQSRHRTGSRPHGDYRLRCGASEHDSRSLNRKRARNPRGLLPDRRWPAPTGERSARTRLPPVTRALKTRQPIPAVRLSFRCRCY